MLQFEELKRQLEEQEAALEELGQALGLEKLREEVDMLEHKSAEPGFWDNMEQAQKVTQRMAALKAKDESYQKLRARLKIAWPSSRWGTRPRTCPFCPRPRGSWRPSPMRLPP